MLAQSVERWWCLVLHSLVGLGVLGLLVQCTSSGESDDGSGPEVPSPQAVFLERVAGDGQTGVVGQPLPQPLRVAVRDATGQPVVRWPLTFRVTRGNGRLTGPQPLDTDAQGQAAVGWTLGTQAGGQRVEVTGSELAPLTLGATAVADRESARLIQVAGNNQRGFLGEILAPLVVRLEEQFGNPLAGEEVRAKILRGGVEFVAGNMRETDANGVAQFRVRVTAVVRVEVVDVTVPTLPQVEQVRFELNRTHFAVAASWPVAVADLNGDGALDVVTAGTILLGRGDGTFAPVAVGEVGDMPRAMAVGDLNGDRALDLVTANANSRDVSILLGGGDGTFAAAAPVAVEGAPGAVAVGDVNGDETLDVVTANGLSDLSHEVTILLGRGDGTFAGARRVTVGFHPRDVAVADVDGNGALDVVTANEFSHEVAILPGGGGMAPSQPLHTFRWVTIPRRWRWRTLTGIGRWTW